MIEGILKPKSILIEDVMTKGNTVKSALEIAKINCQKIDLVIPIIFRGTPQDICDLQKKLKVEIDPLFYEAEFDD